MKFKIDGGVYYCPMDIEEITVEKWIKVKMLEEKEMPEEMKAIIDEKDKKKRGEKVKGVDMVVYSHKIIPYMAKVVSVMCDVDYDLIISGEKGMDFRDVEMLYKNCLSAGDRFRVVEDFKSFEFEGEVYYLPEKFMAGSKVIDFMEAAQFQAYYRKLDEGVWGALPFVVSVLARKKGEGYSEERVLINGERFKGLGLDVALNVSFFLMRRSVKLNENSLFYILADRLRLLKQELRN